MGEYCTLIKTCVQIMPWMQSNVISRHVRWGIRKVDTSPWQLPTPAVSLISKRCVFLQSSSNKNCEVGSILGLFRSIALGKASKFSDVVLRNGFFISQTKQRLFAQILSSSYVIARSVCVINSYGRMGTV